MVLLKDSSKMTVVMPLDEDCARRKILAESRLSEEGPNDLIPEDAP